MVLCYEEIWKSPFLTTQNVSKYLLTRHFLVNSELHKSNQLTENQFTNILIYSCQYLRQGHHSSPNRNGNCWPPGVPFALQHFFFFFKSIKVHTALRPHISIILLIQTPTVRSCHNIIILAWLIEPFATGNAICAGQEQCWCQLCLGAGCWTALWGSTKLPHSYSLREGTGFGLTDWPASHQAVEDLLKWSVFVHVCVYTEWIAMLLLLLIKPPLSTRIKLI